MLWNDRDYVTAPALQSIAGLLRIWFRVGATQQYYPVLHSAFWFEHLLWGDHPLGYHLANVGLHALSACLFAAILRLLAPQLPASSTAGSVWPWLAGLLFALHPVEAESVAWISEQKNTLSTVFYLLSAWLYLQPAETPGGARYALATAAFVLALLSKSVAATLPAALLVILWWQRGALQWRRDVRPLLPWFGLGAGIGLFTAWVEHTYIGAAGPAFQLTFSDRLLVATRAVWFYLGKLLWPAHLIFIYPRWDIDTAAAWQWLFPLALAAALGLLWLRHRRWPAAWAVALLFIGSLFPVLGFLNVYAFIFSFVADHFQYLPSLAPLGLIAAGWGVWARTGSRWAPLAAGGALALLGFLTWRQAADYRSVEGFYRAIIQRNPAAWMAQNNLGLELDATGRAAEAVQHYRAALQFDPGNPDARNNLGVDLLAQGQFAEAVSQFEAALRARPEFTAARTNLAKAHDRIGVSLLASHRPNEAIGEFRSSLSVDSRAKAAWLNLGVAQAAAGQPDAAAESYQQALRLDPQYAEAHNNLGLVWARRGGMPSAIAEFRAAVQADPRFARAHYNLGVALRAAGDSAAGAAELHQAATLEAAARP